jgi:SAM-dependent methyltransferase
VSSIAIGKAYEWAEAVAGFRKPPNRVNVLHMTSDTIAAVREHWDRAATTYDRLHGHGLFGERERAAWCGLLDRILPNGTRTVLDVGTGTGFLSLRLAELGHSVVGVDNSPEMLAAATQAARERALDIRFLLGGALLTEADGTERLEELKGMQFDAVVSRHVLWTMPQPENAIRAWRDATVPGGAVIAIDGTWCGGSARHRAGAATGRALRRISGRPHEHGNGVYAQNGSETFPLMGTRSPQPAHNAFLRAGLHDVRSEYLDGIDSVERREMSFADRLASPWRRYLVEGTA